MALGVHSGTTYCLDGAERPGAHGKLQLARGRHGGQFRGILVEKEIESSQSDSGDVGGVEESGEKGSCYYAA